jgi:hypothetical protein
MVISVPKMKGKEELVVYWTHIWTKKNKRSWSKVKFKDGRYGT